VGEYFMWAAADDVWDKDWIDVLYPILCANHCLSYGMVQTIDGKGDRIRHIANNRRFDFTGSVFIRRLKYFVQPAFLGKANLIYGVFPQKVFTRQLFDALGLNTNGTDMLALYSLLKVIEIRGGESVFLYKRIHSDCAGGGAESLNITVFNRVSRLLLHTIIVQHIKIIDYSSLSGVAERISQLTLIPVLFVLDLSYLVSNKLKIYR